MTGLGVGICGLAKPLIVSELAPPHMRGTLVSLVAVGQSVGLNLLYVVSEKYRRMSMSYVTYLEWDERACLLDLGDDQCKVIVAKKKLDPEISGNQQT